MVSQWYFMYKWPDNFDVRSMFIFLLFFSTIYFFFPLRYVPPRAAATSPFLRFQIVIKRNDPHCYTQHVHTLQRNNILYIRQRYTIIRIRYTSAVINQLKEKQHYIIIIRTRINEMTGSGSRIPVKVTSSSIVLYRWNSNLFTYACAPLSGRTYVSIHKIDDDSIENRRIIYQSNRCSTRYFIGLREKK